MPVRGNRDCRCQGKWADVKRREQAVPCGRPSPAARRRSAGARRAGFTLIELLAAMAILVMIVLMLGQLFTDASRAWTQGHRNVLVNGNARAALEVMAREIAAVGADETLSFRVLNGASTNLGYVSDKLDLVTLSYTPAMAATGLTNAYRAGAQVGYYVARMDTNTLFYINRYRILRRETLIFNAVTYRGYVTNVWWDGSWASQGGVSLLENVRCFSVTVYGRDGLPYLNSYTSSVSGPPGWIDVRVSLLGDDDAIKVAVMGGNTAEAIQYADQKAVWFSRRIYLDEVRGYNVLRGGGW